MSETSASASAVKVETLLRCVAAFKETRFSDIYQRNNKRGGLKNLRCFPDCGAQHKERGFCGRSVKVAVAGAGDETVCFGQFVRADLHADSSAGLNPELGDCVPLTMLEALERSPSEVTKPFIRGEAGLSSPDSQLFEFNRKLKGWHYGWAANKHSCNAEHVFKVYVFERCASSRGLLWCRATLISSPFMLFCRRRRRFTIQPTAPISKPGSSKNSSKAQQAAAAAPASASDAESETTGPCSPNFSESEEEEEDELAPLPPRKAVLTATVKKEPQPLSKQPLSKQQKRKPQPSRKRAALAAAADKPAKRASVKPQLEDGRDEITDPFFSEAHSDLSSDSDAFSSASSEVDELINLGALPEFDLLPEDTTFGIIGATDFDFSELVGEMV
jgi:hypothetical protein